jgi:alginate O-acetyltransferase complex protein AlgI
MAGYGGTFLFCGFWHGATPNFLVWGLWHAVGFIIQDGWTRYQRSRGIKSALSKGVLHDTLDTLLTFAFVSVGWIFFVLPWGKLVQIRVW